MKEDPIKPFHFDGNMQKALEDLVEAYLVLTASLEAARPILRDEGVDLLRYDGALVEADRRLVAFLRSGILVDQEPQPPAA